MYIYSSAWWALWEAFSRHQCRHGQESLWVKVLRKLGSFWLLSSFRFKYPTAFPPLLLLLGKLFCFALLIIAHFLCFCNIFLYAPFLHLFDVLCKYGNQSRFIKTKRAGKINKTEFVALFNQTIKSIKKLSRRNWKFRSHFHQLLLRFTSPRKRLLYLHRRWDLLPHSRKKVPISSWSEAIDSKILERNKTHL